MGRRLDVLARRICKENAGYRCQRCGVQGDSSSIEWAHIEPRRKKAIRWDQNNCLALCNAKLNNCHRWFDSIRISPVKWLLEEFPDKAAWLVEEVEEGRERSQMLTTDTVADRLLLEEELKKVVASL